METKKKGFFSSAFWATAPLSGTMLAAALAQPGLSDLVRIALVLGAAFVQAIYVVGNVAVKK